MKYHPILCPECGEPADGTVDIVPARAVFGEVNEETGEAEYGGDTECFWDGQYSLPENDPNHTLLECHDGHQWLAEHRNEDDPDYADPQWNDKDKGESKPSVVEDRPELTEEQMRKIGGAMAKMLMLRRDPDHPDRWKMTWGNKTDLGVFHTVRRLSQMVDNGEEILP